VYGDRNGAGNAFCCLGLANHLAPLATNERSES